MFSRTKSGFLTATGQPTRSLRRAAPCFLLESLESIAAEFFRRCEMKTCLVSKGCRAISAVKVQARHDVATLTVNFRKVSSYEISQRLITLVCRHERPLSKPFVYRLAE